ncbi:MAG TPA: hypothetical protein VM597_12130 [Gemmataceae bacterium]|nr:hypothetical protein [Gemmataceae bacterium]
MPQATFGCITEAGPSSVVPEEQRDGAPVAVVSSEKSRTTAWLEFDSDVRHPHYLDGIGPYRITRAVRVEKCESAQAAKDMAGVDDQAWSWGRFLFLGDRAYVAKIRKFLG